ncbi:DEKNAAC104341 [Brettanomyces naardenensis]|uniref:DEKNAAC104341 n=1 Tax=Brettanomyces naardenensis TaxID=13370 RepID=A0A448YQR6_BRENA|nr:DEKNAAC104341 [Brettanomyces naardenensis]
MQGFGAKKYDLPAPYGLKPRKGKTRLRKMDKVARNYFTTPQRKLIGYLILLTLTGFLVFQIIPIISPKETDVDYEIDLSSNGGGAEFAGVRGQTPDVELETDDDELEKKLDSSMQKLVSERGGLPNAFKGERKKNVFDLGEVEIEE